MNFLKNFFTKLKNLPFEGRLLYEAAETLPPPSVKVTVLLRADE